MKKILFGLSLLACAAGVTAAEEATFPVCVSFAPAGYCDAMQYDGENSATWKNYDCGGSAGAQTKAVYSLGKTVCKGAKGCNPAAAYGWDALNWKFKFAKNTGTLTGISGGVKTVIQQDMPISVTSGACSVAEGQGGVSSLAR
ncbi:hypothetical protein [Ideonella sp. YS5]|uniref:hypothetical protein n=1 Tax=Ideonella sp. YS5 TaxID=3453714 RepID=UPI003EED95D5